MRMPPMPPIHMQAVKSVGVKGLYSGLQPSLLGTAVSQGIYFYLCAVRHFETTCIHCRAFSCVYRLPQL